MGSRSRPWKNHINKNKKRREKRNLGKGKTKNAEFIKTGGNPRLEGQSTPHANDSVAKFSVEFMGISSGGVWIALSLMFLY